jgi:RNA polymerase-binding transcription factor DksA
MPAEVVGGPHRVAAGEYGFRLDCEEHISVKRLSAVPWAARCRSCQQRADRYHSLAAMQVYEEELSGVA